MNRELKQAVVTGVERVAGWADLLDEINVFPVADGDTGRNLVLSLAPMRRMDSGRDMVINRLRYSARGNSGNIAAEFFSGFLEADALENLALAAMTGRDRAAHAVSDPRSGTMLDVFDTLAGELRANGAGLQKAVPRIIAELEHTVLATTGKLPALHRAGVVDAGALGMFIFLDGFFNQVIGNTIGERPIGEAFKERLRISSAFRENDSDEYCVDVMVRPHDDPDIALRRMAEHGDNVVAVAKTDGLKVHLHTRDREALRKTIETIGDVTAWSDDHIGGQVAAFRNRTQQGAVHIMTDAAGSITRDDALELGITLLDSYILTGDDVVPETLADAPDLYRAMRGGAKVSTAQASVFERRQHYHRVMSRFDHIVYMCVGSVYTGNFGIAMDWKQDHDTDNRMTVIDSGAASGRLGLAALAAARFASGCDDPDAVVRFARNVVNQCREFVFLDRLKYLAAGGRLSKPGAFFGDMLHMKPIITPTPDGAKKAGVVRRQEDQVAFAMEKLEHGLENAHSPMIMLEYSDNRQWVRDKVEKLITHRFPNAEILLHPMSLTSGVHMGPGTWAVAFLPERESG